MTYTNPVLLCLLLLAFVGILRGRRIGKALATAALAGLFLWSWPPTTWLSSGSLEWWFPPSDLSSRDAQAIVVLSGGTQPEDPAQPGDLPSEDTYLRCAHAAWLYQHWRAVPVVATGGRQNTGSHAVLAQVMRSILQKEGTPDSMIWTEDQSHSTYENALYTARLLRAHHIQKIVLVTEAYHMLRAEKCFRRQGLDVIPAPCFYRYLQFTGLWSQFLPSAKAIHYNDEALHEWIGLAWYRMSGKI